MQPPEQAKWPRPALAAALVALTIALSACGGEDAATSTPNSAPGAHTTPAPSSLGSGASAESDARAVAMTYLTTSDPTAFCQTLGNNPDTGLPDMGGTIDACVAKLSQQAGENGGVGLPLAGSPMLYPLHAQKDGSFTACAVDTSGKLAQTQYDNAPAISFGVSKQQGHWRVEGRSDVHDCSDY
jgi:hypothetical protein